MTLSPTLHTRSASRLLTLAALLACPFAARAVYEVPNAAYAPPTTYYNTATGVGSTLRTNLHTIVTNNFVGRSYGDSRYNMATKDSNGVAKVSIDQDPNNASNIILDYNRASIPGAWDAGITWNREHVWPKSLLNLTSTQVSNTYTGVASDAFELRPTNPGINSARSNWGYGYYPTTTGVYNNTTTTFGLNSDGNDTYWYPGAADTGDSARAIFYMATRYFDPANSSRGTSNSNLELVNGAASLYNFGDLQSLLHWNYMDGVDNFERRRNQYIYGSTGDTNTHTLNPDFYQNNRNPFIDHPEYVWAVFGKDATGTQINNSSQLSLAAPAADGSSSATVSLRVMKNGTFGTANATLTKTGDTPTTFDVTASGNISIVVPATASSATHVYLGAGQPMDYGNQTRTIPLTLTASTATTGLKTATVTINNTDLTSAGAGKGSADANDVLTVNGSVLDKRTLTPNATSFAYGTVLVGAPLASAIHLATSGDDNSFTRVTVSGSAAADANGISITGANTLFNAANATSNHTLGGAFSAAGAKSGTLSLAVATAENGGAGLTGEGAYPSLPFAYSGTALDHATPSFSASANASTLTLNFGTYARNAASPALPFTLANRVGTAGFTAGLDFDSASTSSRFTTTLAPFSNLTAGSASSFSASLTTAATGIFSDTLTLQLSDQDLPGATSSSLLLTLVGNVALPGDADLSGTVDLSDFNTWFTNVGAAVSDYSLGDFDRSGIVDLSDFNTWFANVGLSEPLALSASPVPEPASLLLLSLAALPLLTRRRHP